MDIIMMLRLNRFRCRFLDKNFQISWIDKIKNFSDKFSNFLLNYKLSLNFLSFSNFHRCWLFRVETETEEWKILRIIFVSFLHHSITTIVVLRGNSLSKGKIRKIQKIQEKIFHSLRCKLRKVENFSSFSPSSLYHFVILRFCCGKCTFFCSLFHIVVSCQLW